MGKARGPRRRCALGARTGSPILRCRVISSFATNCLAIPSGAFLNISCATRAGLLRLGIAKKQASSPPSGERETVAGRGQAVKESGRAEGRDKGGQYG